MPDAVDVVGAVVRAMVVITAIDQDGEAINNGPGFDDGKAHVHHLGRREAEDAAVWDLSVRLDLHERAHGCEVARVKAAAVDAAQEAEVAEDEVGPLLVPQLEG